ncbi:hypothetical protein [Microseira wollei]|uniref:Uncharacterized protein n=1 Tax=Microseira wollei NIES-4236 TaxID=2530354 RepID=A0AAV3XTL0_9CYAN|nr:hypothetical protein [Microseira wollei]GET44666.1 hypothetical protein MiSe_94990 [Microseira wollei NIES-4236]
MIYSKFEAQRAVNFHLNLRQPAPLSHCHQLHLVAIPGGKLSLVPFPAVAIRVELCDRIGESGKGRGGLGGQRGWGSKGDGGA